MVHVIANAALALILLSTTAATPSVRVEAERAAGAGAVVRDATASGGRALALTQRGTARLRLAGAGRLVVVARARRCAGAPKLTVTADGRGGTERVRSRGWGALRLRPAVGAGTHTVTLRLRNPRRGGNCRRTVLIDAVRIVPADRWVPAPSTTWQWQLDGALDLSVAADMYDVDLFETPAATVDAIHARGARAVCYLSAGSYEEFRPDAGDFPARVLGKPLEGWPGERWLDVRRRDVLGPIMERRMDLCRDKGFDAVEPDNVDGYANRSGFPLRAADQLAYNRMLARAAHARGLSIGLKNDLDQVAALEPDFDWALNEQCFQYDECGLLAPFTRAGKAVFVAEYELAPSAFCARAKADGLMAMRKRLDLDALREPCW